MLTPAAYASVMRPEALASATKPLQLYAWCMPRATVHVTCSVFTCAKATRVACAHMAWQANLHAWKYVPDPSPPTLPARGTLLLSSPCSQPCNTLAVHHWCIWVSCWYTSQTTCYSSEQPPQHSLPASLLTCSLPACCCHGCFLLRRCDRCCWPRAGPQQNLLLPLLL